MSDNPWTNVDNYGIDFPIGSIFEEIIQPGEENPFGHTAQVLSEVHDCLPAE